VVVHFVYMTLAYIVS